MVIPAHLFPNLHHNSKDFWDICWKTAYFKKSDIESSAVNDKLKVTRVDVNQ